MFAKIIFMMFFLRIQTRFVKTAITLALSVWETEFNNAQAVISQLQTTEILSYKMMEAVVVSNPIMIMGLLNVNLVSITV